MSQSSTILQQCSCSGNTPNLESCNNTCNHSNTDIDTVVRLRRPTTSTSSISLNQTAASSSGPFCMCGLDYGDCVCCSYNNNIPQQQQHQKCTSTHQVKCLGNNASLLPSCCTGNLSQHDSNSSSSSFGKSLNGPCGCGPSCSCGSSSSSGTCSCSSRAMATESNGGQCCSPSSSCIPLPRPGSRSRMLNVCQCSGTGNNNNLKACGCRNSSSSSSFLGGTAGGCICLNCSCQKNCHANNDLQISSKL